MAENYKSDHFVYIYTISIAFRPKSETKNEVETIFI